MLKTFSKIFFVFFIVLSLFAFLSPCEAQTYKVGVGTESRFVIHNEDGSYAGFEIELWKEIAKQLDIQYEFEELPLLPNLLEDLKTGKVDFGLWMLNIDRSRSEYVKFTYPYFVSNLAILTPAKGHTFGILIRPIFKPMVARLIITIFVIMFLFGNILWFAEKGSRSIISEKYFPGIFQAMWCTFAIQSTIGFGDIIPNRWLARLLSIPIWICGLLLVAVITAQLLTNYTKDQYHSLINDYRDLSGKVVATVNGTVAAEIVDTLGVKKMITVPKSDDLKRLYPRLESGEIDAIVFDYPFLADLEATLQKEDKHPFLATDGFHRQFYAIAMNKKLAEQNPDLFEKINLKVLDLTDNGFIRQLQLKWFGNLDIK